MASPKRPSRSTAVTKRRPGRTHQGARVGEPSALPIVGIGSSAGGLEALEGLFEAMPADTGMAFVVVTHQLPDHTSLLPELLERYTTIPIAEVKARTTIQPNHLYLSPPGWYLTIVNATLELRPRVRTQGPPLPIDSFFRALAEDQQEWAIGIILSGTGTDGTLGLQAIKGYGGLTLVQAADEARFPSMPQSAVEAGAVDHMLPVAVMPETLLALVQTSYLLLPTETGVRADLTESFVREILIRLRNHTRHDFSAYKSMTISRRLERRMAVNQVNTAAEYLQLVQDQPDELEHLFRDLLIGVTAFFRDSEAFDLLATHVLPELLRQHPEDQDVRVWVAGCSTGEEAYSLAIVLRECIARLGLSCQVQIFATDLDRRSITKARNGIYPEGIARDVSPERLERFFSHAEGYYTIAPEIREMVLFAEQNIIADPPFTKIDLISCRNLLIYMEADLQRRLFSLFHYALKPEGLLFLGSAETIGNFTDFFKPIDRRWKIFQRLAPLVDTRTSTSLAVLPALKRPDVVVPRSPDKLREATFEPLMDRLLVQSFVPPSVLVNERGDIVFIHGDTDPFLQLPSGAPSHNVFRMAREGLRAGLTVALHQAVVTPTEPVQRRIEMQIPGGTATIDVRVQSVRDPELLQELFLITFQPVPVEIPRARPRRRAQSSHQEEVEVLESELQEVKKNLQVNLEEAATVNEELNSANEELQSINEELQSSNEELETAKEEMQSLNEELQTVNSELHQKLDALSQINDDMKNLLNSTDIATLFLDNQLHIKRFTPQASTVIKLIDSDVGRPVADLVSNLSYLNFAEDAQDVVRTLIPKEAEIPTTGGQWYFVRMLPYRTASNMIDGLVITFLDITRQKQAELQNYEARVYTESIVETIRDALVVLDVELRVVSANRAFYRAFQQTPDSVTGNAFFWISNSAWRSAELQRLFEGIVTSNATFENVPFVQVFSDIGEKSLVLNARRIERAPGLLPLILLVIEDRSEPPDSRAEARGSERATNQLEAPCDDPT